MNIIILKMHEKHTQHIHIYKKNDEKSQKYIDKKKCFLVNKTLC